MIKLKNIKIEGKVLECFFIPEDSREKGKLIVSIPDGKILKCEYPKGYEYCKNHIEHAIDVILEMEKKGEFPEEKLIMWY